MNNTRKILRALHGGAKTSEEISRLACINRRNISVALCRLADRGVVERAGVVNAGRLGRPYVRWRSRRASSQVDPSPSP